MPTGNPDLPLFDLVLHEPEIPPNAGNVIRLCANTGCRLHLIRPLGFSLRDKQLQRAGLDYHDAVKVLVHSDWTACRTALAGRRLFAVTTRGGQRYDTPAYRAGDVFVLGSESSGLPASVLAEFAPGACLRVPMLVTSRCLNLSNTAALVVYEAWRQVGFAGGS